MWKGILKCAQTLANNFKWQLGGGKRILFWLDNWFGNEGLWTKVNFIDARDYDITLDKI